MVDEIEIFNDLAVEIENGVKNYIIALTLRIHELISISTPVDTGWAANNWLISVGEPVYETVGSQKNVPVAVASSQARTRRLASYDLNDGIVFIVNNVPYIARLNGGYSTQAPPNFVLKAIQQAISELDPEDFI